MRVFRGPSTGNYCLCFDDTRESEMNVIWLSKDGDITRSTLYTGLLVREGCKEIPNAQEVFKAAYNIIKEMDEGTRP